MSKQITEDLRDVFRGRLHFDRLTRGLYSTDASAFQIEPLAVAVPEDAASIAVLVRYCHAHNIPVIPRGAGTGLAGESLGPAIILDLSVHFRRILHIGADTVTVQPGVILQHLNEELAKVGRRFAPDPASATTCTLGGMIATNASGGNAFHHGYTRDYIAALKVVWDTGEEGELNTFIGEEIPSGDSEPVALASSGAPLVAEERPTPPLPEQEGGSGGTRGGFPPPKQEGGSGGTRGGFPLPKQEGSSGGTQGRFPPPTGGGVGPTRAQRGAEEKDGKAGPTSAPKGATEKDEIATPASLARIDSSDRTATISKSIRALLDANAERIALTRTRTPFDRCGYQLHGVLTARGVDLAKLMAGSEGTLAIVTEATLRTVPLPGGTALVLLGFPTLDAAVRAGLALRQHGPVACDLLDRRLISVTRGIGLPSVGAALIVSFEADTERAAAERAWGAVEALRREHVLRVLVEPTCDPDGVAHIRAVRDAAVTGLYAVRGPRPLAFIEDVGVPADALPEFLTGAQDILKRFAISGTFLVHTLTGQVHTRPLLDLERPADRAKLWPVAEAVHTLALALGGTVSTQHGTGLARTPWVERQYGSIVPVFRELKRIFDPKGILNPGKIVGPDPSREAWPLRRPIDTHEPAIGGEAPIEESVTGAPSSLVAPLLVWKEAPAEEVARCTGCGSCRTRSTPERMCPTFRATGDEAATPRGLANLMRMLDDPTVATAEEVRAVLELCVNCKMCRDECPSGVNVPKLVLEARARHHAEHGPDRTDWILARAESLASMGSNFAPLVNVLLARRPVRWLVDKLFGISRHRRLPAFALRNFFRRARGAGLTKKRAARSPEPETEPGATLSRVRAPQAALRARKVALFIDVFAAYNDPLIGAAAVAVLQHNGIEVFVPPRQVGCGIAPLARGDLDAARDAARRNVRVLADLAREGYRIVSPEPSAVLMLTQDYLDLLTDPDAAAVAANTVELTAYLGELHARGILRTDFRTLDVTLGHHIPCHMKALRGPTHSPGLLSLIPGLRVHTIDAGCSGMGGTWGLCASNYETSLAAGAAVFAELNRPRILFGSTECSSCRMQMEEGSGKRTLHPIQYLAYAYGLLPELEPRFHRPLGRLLSD